MSKRCFCTPICFVMLALLLTACNFSVHAKDAPSTTHVAHTTTISQSSLGAAITAIAAASPVADATAAVAASPGADSTSTSSTSPATDTTVAAPVPQPPLPAVPSLAPDTGTSIIFNKTGQQRLSGETRTSTGQFLATPGYIVRIACHGSGLIKIAIGNSIFNELSCPQSDNVNTYYNSLFTARSTISITTRGAIGWRVMIESAG